jgi:hypothetical protein
MKGFALIAAIVITSSPLYAAVPASPSGGSWIRGHGGVHLDRLRLQQLIHAGEDSCWNAPPAPTPFPGIPHSWQTPPLKSQWKPCFPKQGGLTVDPQIAVSHTRVVVTSQSRMAFYEKSGTYRGSITARQMFSDLGLDNGTPSAVNSYKDLRAVYDSHRNRFWLMATGLTASQPDPDKRRSITAVAVSKSNSPLDGWYLYWWDAVSQFGHVNGSVYQAGDIAEEPFIGIDEDAFHQANGVFNSGTRRYWRITFFPAATMAAGVAGPIAGRQYSDLKNPNGGAAWMVQPVVHHGPTSRSYYASRQGGSDAVVWAVSNPLEPGEQIDRTAVTLTAWNSPVNAPQDGSTDLIRMNRLGTAVLKATYRGGWLHLVTNDAENWFGDGMLSSIRLARMDVSGFPVIPTGPGFVDVRFGKNHPFDQRGAHMHYAWPSLAVNKDGDMVTVYSRSGDTIFPEARYSAYFISEGQLRRSRELKQGEAAYDIPFYGGTVLPWGETAGASVDPYDDTAVWMVHQYASQNGGWLGNHELWVGKVLGELAADVAVYAIREESDPPTVGGGGMPVDILYRVRNEGDGPFDAVTVEIFIVGDDGRRVLVSTTEQSGLAPGEEARVKETIVIPAGTPAGRYQILIVADPASRITEYSEENNTASLPLLVTER